MLPAGDRKGGTGRGVKKPGAPPMSVAKARCLVDQAMGVVALEPYRVDQDEADWNAQRRVVIASQKLRKASTRFSGGLPAIKAELMAPIEMPATQSGCRLASANAW